MILLRAKTTRRGPYSTLLAARPDEAGPAGALAGDVVAVGAVLAAADLGAVPAVEARRTAWTRVVEGWRKQKTT